jgi:hypothetical protein
VDAQLEAAGTYWVIARTQDHPHPRPVWGVWDSDHLYLSIGTPVTLRTLARDPAVTVHLDSGTDVVIVEGRAAGPEGGAGAIEAYNRKYDWNYDPGEYGPLQRVDADVVLAWRAGGWAGRLPADGAVGPPRLTACLGPDRGLRAWPRASA